jgi:Gpi18-like mannosyltransferase
LKKIAGLSAVFILTAAALMVRVALLPFSNIDLQQYLLPWFDTIVQNGGFAALKEPFYNYTPPYMYLMAAAAILKTLVSPLVAIKMISICFDFLAAWAMYRIIRVRHPHHILPWAGFFAVLFAPTVLFDGAYWGQCDVIYSTFLLGSVYFGLTRRPSWSIVCFASAFAFKAQAAFLAPLILLLLIKGVLRWRHLLIGPLVYLAWFIPVLLVGYPIEMSIATYLQQTNTYQALNLNAPNIYLFISDRYYAVAAPLGFLVSGLACFLLIWLYARKIAVLDAEKILVFGVISMTLLPFLLPKMHERYFFPAALLAIALPFFGRRTYLVPTLLQASSLISYAPFLRQVVVLPLALAAGLNGLLLALLIYRLFQPAGLEENPDLQVQV